MNEKPIWDYLHAMIQNDYGVAGLMGNLYVESKLEPMTLQGSYARKHDITSEEYTARVNDGRMTEEEFSHDGAGYGLAQWTYWSRKQKLYQLAYSRRASVGSLSIQLDYLWQELQTYVTVLNTLKTAKSVREASDIVVTRYEKPANQSEELMQNRANYGQKYYDQFAHPEKVIDNVAKPTKVVAKVNVNLRAGNGTNYAKISTLSAGKSLPLVAKADNDWYAVDKKTDVLWVKGEFVELK